MTVVFIYNYSKLSYKVSYIIEIKFISLFSSEPV